MSRLPAPSVKLMTAYACTSSARRSRPLRKSKGVIGEPRLFVSSFTMQVEPPNIRLEQEMGGGTLYDIGIYCINAARHLFGAEPVEVACVTTDRSPRGGDVELSACSILKFPGDRMATFCTSFGAAKTSEYRVGRAARARCASIRATSSPRASRCISRWTARSAP
jgi:glucose-fructose oxidoreductase